MDRPFTNSSSWQNRNIIPIKEADQTRCQKPNFHLNVYNLRAFWLYEPIDFTNLREEKAQFFNVLWWITDMYLYSAKQIGVGESVKIGPRFSRRLQIDLSTSFLPRWTSFRPSLVANALYIIEKCLVGRKNTLLSSFSTSFHLVIYLVINEVTSLSTKTSHQNQKD